MDVFKSLTNALRLPAQPALAGDICQVHRRVLVISLREGVGDVAGVQADVEELARAHRREEGKLPSMCPKAR
ncbi:hypothetical protein MPLB_1270011 [Mesorhizobium sp. ORS 3324]|nr:hypothetical protein MPLB_1270011 [Mesorhizobium sp. ORS 3324]